MNRLKLKVMIHVKNALDEKNRDKYSLIKHREFIPVLFYCSLSFYMRLQFGFCLQSIKSIDILELYNRTKMTIRNHIDTDSKKNQLHSLSCQ